MNSNSGWLAESTWNRYCRGCGRMFYRGCDATDPASVAWAKRVVDDAIEKCNHEPGDRPKRVYLEEYKKWTLRNG